MSFPAPTKAYDLDLLTRSVVRAGDDNHGWAFGLPPGIAPEQWPLDPVSGYPLMHGFTLLLPPDYRVHGPDVVALSFFATAPDQNDGGAIPDEALRRAIVEGVADDPDIRFFAERARLAHPRLHRFQDILGYEYALILLTAAEFESDFRPPPDMPDLPILARSIEPAWLAIGSALAFYRNTGAPLAERPEESYGYKLLGSEPASALEENRAIRWTPRAIDPNAGKAPEDYFSGDAAPSGYQNYFYWKDCVIDRGNFREHDWASGHKSNHIGGTMRPVQGIPSMSPFYVGFEEYFGGYNFGSGNAQLDFLDMKFDWACG